jgi:hypothetical protein
MKPLQPSDPEFQNPPSMACRLHSMWLTWSDVSESAPPPPWIDSHHGSCAACRTRWIQTFQLQQRLRTTPPPARPALPAGLEQCIMDRIRAEPPPRRPDASMENPSHILGRPAIMLALTCAIAAIILWAGYPGFQPRNIPPHPDAFPSATKDQPEWLDRPKSPVLASRTADEDAPPASWLPLPIHAPLQAPDWQRWTEPLSATSLSSEWKAMMHDSIQLAAQWTASLPKPWFMAPE